MDRIFIEPWLPPLEPSLARLAMEAADEAGQERCGAWPEVRKGGVAFGDLPPFLAWHGVAGGRHHLFLVQAREVGALVPGARPRPLAEARLERLDLEALAQPLARHPAFPGGASVHVLHLLGPGRGRVRTYGVAGGPLVPELLARLTGIKEWPGLEGLAGET